MPLNSLLGSGKRRSLGFSKSFFLAATAAAISVGAYECYLDSRDQIIYTRNQERLRNSEKYRDLLNRPLIKSLLSKGYKESLYYEKLPHFSRRLSLTSYLFNKNSIFEFEPIVLADKTNNETYCVFQISDSGSQEASNSTIHYGIMTTIMDEAISRSGFSALPHQVGLTAKSDYHWTGYKVPVGTYLVLKSTVTEKKGRKATILGELRDFNTGKLVSKASVLLVEPWWVKYIIYSL